MKQGLVARNVAKLVDLPHAERYEGQIPTRVWYLFKQLLKRAGLPDIRFHDVRHGAATVLLVAKMDLKAVSELLGHSSIAITVDIYQSVLPEQQAACKSSRQCKCLHQGDREEHPLAGCSLRLTREGVED